MEKTKRKNCVCRMTILTFLAIFIHQLGTVAIYATLFAAIYVNGEKGCVFDFENIADFALECNNVKNSWMVNEDVKDSPQKKVLILSPEEEGCLKSKNAITLNLTSPVTFRFYHDSDKDENKKLTLRLIPKEGSCPDEECVWEIANDGSYKSGEWIAAEHPFPLKSAKEYYVQIQAGKAKGKLLLDSLTFSSATGDFSGCHIDNEDNKVASETGMNEINLFDQLVGVKGNGSGSFAPSLREFSKNLMLTSASLLTLNNLLN